MRWRLAPLAFLLVACSPQPPAQTEFLAMGTTVSIVFGQPPPTTAGNALYEARSLIEQIGAQWYPWAGDAELTRLNAALADGVAFTASPSLAQILLQSREYARLSNRAFDPGVGALVKLWGMHRETPKGVVPTADQLEAWRARPAGILDIVVDGTTVRSDRRDVAVDLGAIGKGFAVDRAIEHLRQRGIANALVNAGGNLRAIGKQHGQPWRIGVRAPRGAEPLAHIELHDDEGAATSGDYERFVVVDGKRMHHLLDPRTGEPATHTQSVTVLAGDATLADVASTAIFIAGPDRWRDVARALQVEFVLRVDASGAVQVTSALHARLQSASSDARRTEWNVVDL